MESLLPLVAGALERATAEARLATVTRIDPVTGLSNRHHWESECARLLEAATAAGDGLALLVLELDQQPTLATCHGGAGEDELVRGLAAVVQGTVRPVDLAGRWGGGRLAVACAGLDPVGAQRMASRLCEAVQGAPLETRRGPVRVTVSVGVTLLPPQGATLEAMLYAAEGALDDAHAAGGGRPMVAETGVTRVGRRS